MASAPIAAPALARYTPAMPVNWRKLALGAAAVVVVAAWLVRWTEVRAERTEIEGLRSQLTALRASADSCQATLAWRESDFHELDRRVDSLGTEVRDLEALDERGVPQERYPDYLEVFDSYNEAVAPWQAQADSLVAHWGVCRGMVDEHNLMVDSVAKRLDALRGPS